MKKQIKSKKRVKDYGEVYTQEREVKAMLDLVKDEGYRVNSLFLEPTCGNGNFLVEILKRKLSVCQSKEDIIESLKSIYAIDILEDNVKESKERLYGLVKEDLTIDEAFFIMDQNIVCGDSLELLNTPFYTGMKFDVIIGNPPYQLTVSSKNNRAVPLYHKFIEKAISLNPKYITMIIPSRWLTGGDSELKRFRNYMLNDKKINTLVDFEDANDCFSGVDIKGGVCYFLWDKNHHGQCETITFKDGKEQKIKRNLLEDGCDIFIRDYQAISILHKVLAFEEDSFSSLVSAQKPFGVPTNFQSEKKNPSIKQYKLFGNNFSGFINSEQISKNQDWISLYKLFIPKAIGSGNTKKDWVKPLIGLPEEVCTETYVVVSPSKNKNVIKNVLSYTQTKFFHFMLGLKKNTQDALRGAYQLVPIQDFSKPWTDKELYEKYGLTQDEIDYIELMIRPMN